MRGGCLVVLVFLSVIAGWSDTIVYTNGYDIKDAAKVATDKISSFWDDATSFIYKLHDPCKMTSTPSTSIKQLLKSNLIGQSRAIDAVVSAFQGWEFDSEENRKPLVLAITGPTGTGKTETSHLIGQALFNTKGEGVLIFRGEDFSDNVTNPISLYHEQIKSRMASHLSRCQGKSVVIFDEVQKVVPHTLDVFMEALGPTKPVLTYYSHGSTKTIDTRNVVFILVSDIGAERMQKILMAHDTREEVPQAEIVSSVKDALDAQWDRLTFGKMVDEVIPFLPLTPNHIEDIITIKLQAMDLKARKTYWRSLSIKEGVASYLATTRFVKYVQHEATFNSVTRTRVFAKYGARNVESSGPLQRLKAKLFRYLRPWNPDADVVIYVKSDSSSSGEEDDNRILVLESCFEMPIDKDGSEQMTRLTCETVWSGKL